MDRDDDIARFLPEPLPPAPARRQAAIEAALRRFDGVDDAPPAAAGAPRPARPAFAWSPQRRAFAGVLISAALVALVGGPIAWQHMGQLPAPNSGRPHAAAPAPVAATPSAPPALAGANSAPPAENEPQATPVALVPAAPEAASARAAVPPAEAAPPPPPPPPPPPAAQADAMTSVASDKAAPSPRAERFAATRVPAPAPPAAPPEAAAEAENAGGSIVVTGSRVRSPGRGDWNACTVDDPSRNLASCRRLVDREAKGEAAAHLAEGLDRAWRGDAEEAIAAFDKAIAAAPRSAFAYLNRGLARRRSGDLDGALADLDRAVRLAPRQARNYYNRSLILRERGAAARARHDEDRAIELDPRYGDAVQ